MKRDIDQLRQVEEELRQWLKEYETYFMVNALRSHFILKIKKFRSEFFSF